MDSLLFSVSFFTVVVTTVIGYFIIQKFFPNNNKEILISDAFKEEDFIAVIKLTEGKEFKIKCSLDVYIYSAQSRYNIGMYEESILWWETALKRLELLEKDKILIELAIGDSYLAMENFKKAEIHYRTAVSFKPNDDKANYKLAFLLYKMQRYDICRKILRSVLKNNPSLVDCKKLYAECLAEMGLYTKAIRHYGLLERLNENVLTFNYAKTLKKLKIWDKAYEVYNALLAFPMDPVLREELMVDLVQTCTAMGRFPECFGLLDHYATLDLSQKTKLELSYLRANILFLRGDQMLALKEYAQLHQEYPAYKDLDDTVQKNKHWLNYTFLFNYFTSNESIFESLIIRLTSLGISFLRRSPLYYIGIDRNTVYVFFRDMRAITDKKLKEIEALILQHCTEIEKLELWSLEGISGTYSATGNGYFLTVRSHDDFLVNVNKAVSSMDYLEGAEPLAFVAGFDDAPKVVPKLAEKIDIMTEEILNDKFEIFEDELLSKALD